MKSNSPDRRMQSQRASQRDVGLNIVSKLIFPSQTLLLNLFFPVKYCYFQED